MTVDSSGVFVPCDWTRNALVRVFSWELGLCPVHGSQTGSATLPSVCVALSLSGRLIAGITWCNWRVHNSPSAVIYLCEVQAERDGATTTNAIVERTNTAAAAYRYLEAGGHRIRYSCGCESFEITAF